MKILVIGQGGCEHALVMKHTGDELVLLVTTSLTGDDSENLLGKQKDEVLNMKSELYTMLWWIIKIS